MRVVAYSISLCVVNDRNTKRMGTSLLTTDKPNMELCRLHVA